MSDSRQVRSLVIVGAGPAGLAVARAYREAGGEGSVTMLGREPQVPYARPPLSKEFLRGELSSDELPLQPQEWFAEQRIELKLGCRAEALDPGSGTVSAGGETFHGDALVLATGAEPVRPQLPGVDDPRVLTLRTQPDSELIAARGGQGTSTVVLGTGFIGCEIAASLAMRGCEVVLVGLEDAPQQQRLGSDAAAQIASWLRELGVELRMGAQVAAIDDASSVKLKDGSRVDAELVIAAMGVRPRSELARAAGLALDGDAIRTDEQMRAAASVFAVGDVAHALNRTARRRLRVEHWGDALGQGEVAGRVLAGEDACWDAVPGFWSTIGSRTLKYAAWGDGFDHCRLERHGGGAFTVWYSREGVLVGVLAHDRDEDYEAGQELIRAARPVNRS